MALASRVVEGSETELGPWKFWVPLNGASVVDGMRWIIPTSAGGDGSPSGLVKVSVYCMSSENTTADWAMFWNCASVTRCTVWLGTLTSSSVPSVGSNCGTVRSVSTSVRCWGRDASWQTAKAAGVTAPFSTLSVKLWSAAAAGGTPVARPTPVSATTPASKATPRREKGTMGTLHLRLARLRVRDAPWTRARRRGDASRGQPRRRLRWRSR